MEDVNVPSSAEAPKQTGWSEEACLQWDEQFGMTISRVQAGLFGVFVAERDIRPRGGVSAPWLMTQESIPQEEYDPENPLHGTEPEYQAGGVPTEGYYRRFADPNASVTPSLSEAGERVLTWRRNQTSIVLKVPVSNERPLDLVYARQEVEGDNPFTISTLLPGVSKEQFQQMYDFAVSQTQAE